MTRNGTESATLPEPDRESGGWPVRIDDEVFEILSRSGPTDANRDPPRIVRWLDGWSRADR